MGKPKDNIDGKSKRQMWSGITIGIVIGVVLTLFTPFISHFGNLLFSKFVSPDLSVELSSILITREFQKNLVDVKIKLRLDNKDYIDRDIQLITLENIHTLDSFSLTDTEPISVKSLGYKVASVKFIVASPGLLFNTIPAPGNSLWQLTYKIAGTDNQFKVFMGESSLDRLHFFLVPSSSLKIDRQLLKYHFREIGIYSNLWVSDTNALNWKFHGVDSFSIFLYPLRHINVGVDTNSDGKTDILVRADTLSDAIESGSHGTYTEIIPSYKHLSSRASGFVIGFKPFEIIPQVVRLKWIQASSYDDLITIFGATVDEEVPLTNKEFIYWKYKTVEGL